MWGKRKSDHDDKARAAGGVSPYPEVALASEQLLGTESIAGLDPKPNPSGVEPSGTDAVDRTEAPAAQNRAVQSPAVDEIRFAVTFTRVVSVLTRSPHYKHYKHYTLSDLEWLVVPPILTRQCAVMEAKVNGRQVPVAAALWASVSEEVDRRLSGDLTVPIKLRPDEWRSGETLWLIDAVGDPKAIPLLLQQLGATTFKGNNVKMRTVRPVRQPEATSLQTSN
jgi:cytolysin-activating lysine-acyltransferase